MVCVLQRYHCMYFPYDNLDYKLTIAKKQGIITRVFTIRYSSLLDAVNSNLITRSPEKQK